MDKRIKLHDRCFKLMISGEQIAAQVERIAGEIAMCYRDNERPLIVMGVLNGSALFVSDLVRQLPFACELNFVKLSSYSGTSSTGCVEQLIGIDGSLEGRDIVVVEDIVETGRSIQCVVEELMRCGAASVRICSLTFKPNAYEGSREIDFVGFEIGDEFIVGYGMDYDQLGRTLGDIYVVEE